MAQGPGKYDDICSVARLAAQAECAVVILIGGNRGSGFSMQTKDAQLIKLLPDMLEKMAKEIRADAERLP